MDWKWGLVQLAVAFAIWIWFMRKRFSMQTYSNDLRRAARNLHEQSTEFRAARQAAKESKTQASLRVSELQQLRERISELESANKALTTTLDVSQTRIENLVSSNFELETRATMLKARREVLEADLSSANTARLELLSQLRTDETQRIIALNSLRQPANSLRPPTGLSARSKEAMMRKRKELAVSPMPVSKSPSESFLLGLHPDLSISDDDDDGIDYRAFEESSRALEERFERARVAAESGNCNEAPE